MKKHLRQLNIIPNTLVGSLVLLFAVVTGTYRFEQVRDQSDFPRAFVFERKPDSWLAKLLVKLVPHWTGLTIGQIVFVNDGASRWHEKTVQHELVHVRQQSNLGIVFFLTYTWSSLKHGYWENKYEAEAYNTTEDVPPKA
ncbi:MAG: hypothetical protein JWO15_3600 [Sphingomonadales bacterium]|nr:hypothetical protein [Sphingomonadales bacterium]